MNQTEKRARELSFAVRAISNKPLPSKAPRAITFVSRIESSPAERGEDGVSPIIDHEEIYQKVLERIKKDKSLVVSDLKDGQAFVFNNTKYQTHEMMHGGSASGTIPSFTTNEVVAGSGTAWTLAATPTAGSVTLFGNGQYLTPGGVDYTISGASITTVNSFVAGTIVANYRT